MIMYLLHEFFFFRRSSSSILAEFSTDFKQGMCHTMALPFTLKKYLKAKEELWNLKYFTMQKYNLQKFF
jgi:hypothetical protein